MKKETYTHELKCKFCEKVTGSLEFVDEKARAENFIDEMTNAIITNESVLAGMVDDGSGQARYEINKLKRKLDKARDEVASVEAYHATLPDFETIKESKIAEQGIEDVRCDECTAIHGSYKQMHDRVLGEGGTYDEFKQIMETTDGKSGNFEVELAKLKNGAIAERKEEYETSKRVEMVKSQNELKDKGK